MSKGAGNMLTMRICSQGPALFSIGAAAANEAARRAAGTIVEKCMIAGCIFSRDLLEILEADCLSVKVM